MSRRLVYAFIFICASALASGFVLREFAPIGVMVAVIGLAWLVLFSRRVVWISSVMFLLFALASAAALYVDVPAWLAFVSLCACLLAWDLDHASHGLPAVPSDVKRMEREHLLRLGVVVALGAGGFLVTGWVRVNLTFASAGILAFIGVWGISALIYSLRGRE